MTELTRLKRMTTRPVCVLALVGAALSLTAKHVRAQVVSDSRSCPRCRVQFEVVQRFGDVSGPGSLPQFAPSSITIDRTGRFWVLFYGQSLPLIFDGKGRFFKELGKRGSGPGEFQHPQIAARIAGDSMLILDRVANTATVFDRDLRAARVVRIDAGNFFDLNAEDWPRLHISSAIRTPERIGFPLHTFEMSQSDANLVRTFGLEESNIQGLRGMERLSAHLVRAANGNIWAIDRLRYRISEWTSDGRNVRVMYRKPAWFNEVSDGSYGKRDKPPPAQISGAQFDSEGRLWIFALVPAPTWKDAWVNVPRQLPRGEVPASRGLPDIDKLYRTVVEIIDVRTQRLVATGSINHRIVRTLQEPGFVAAHKLESGQVPTISILRLLLRNPQAERSQTRGGGK